MSRRLPVVATVAAIALTVLSACGGLPVSSAVHVQRTIAGPPDAIEQDIRIQPPAPVPGAGPGDIVRGFLNATADNEDHYGIAREFLAPHVSWNTSSGLLVYSSLLVVTSRRGTPSATDDVTVNVTEALIGSLDTVGRYTPLARDGLSTFALVKVAGEWRIASLPPGVLLTQADLERSYLPSELWWFTPDFSLLVPEQRWLPFTPGARQTSLVRALLTGPSPRFAAGVRSAVPVGTELDGSATLEGTDVVVDLSRTVASVSVAQAKNVFEQLAETLLKQVPTATGVRLTVGGDALPINGVPQRVDLTAVSQVDPDVHFPTNPVLALEARRAFAVPGAAGATLSAAARAALARLGPLDAVASNLDGTGIAVLAGGGVARREVVVVAPSGAARVVVGPGAYTSLSWSGEGTLVVGGPAGLVVVGPKGAARQVRIAGGLPAPIDVVRLARDGVRAAVIAGPVGHRGLYAGILSGGVTDPQLAGLVDITPSLADVSSVGWTSSTQLEVVGQQAGSPPQLWQLDTDGSQLIDDAPLPGTSGLADQLAVVPGAPTLVAADGAIDELVNGGWRRLANGSAPAYPG